jgi:type I restriction enzyme S subunit
MKTKTTQQNIPTGWKTALLGDICSLVESIKVKEGEENYLEIGDINVSNKTYDLSNKDKKTVKGAVKVPKGTLLISKVRPTRGAVVLAQDNVNVSTGFSRINIPNKFFYHIASQDKFLSYLGGQAKGSTYPTCKDEDILGYEILYPADTTEQEKIAEILDVIDKTIEKTNEIIKATEKLKKGLMQQLFTRGIGHTKFKQTKLGEVPESWKVELLDVVVKRGSGHTPSKKVSEYYNGGIKWVSLADSNKLDKGEISETKIEISQKGIENSSANIHPEGTVLMSRDAGIGKSAVMAEDMAVSQHFITWTCGENLNNWYLYYFLQSQKTEFERIAMGSTIKTIGVGYFQKLKIPLPSKAEQETIAEILLAIDAKVLVNKELLAKQTELKKGLMQDLLSGVKRVKV